MDMGTLSSTTFSSLQFLNPSLHSQVLASSSVQSLSLSSAACRRRFYKPLRTPSIPPSPSFLKPLTVASSLGNEPVNDSATRVAAGDQSFALKKKALELSTGLKASSIFLVGINNTTKANLGQLLADALGYYYFDTDSLVEEAAGGKSAAKSLREEDEKGFCDSETEVLTQLSSMGRLVVCAGDGAVQNQTNLALLRYGISVWIDVPLELVAKELVDDRSQFPTSQLSASGSHSEVLSQLELQFEEMRDGYATADATVSLLKVACKLGCDDFHAVTAEDMAMEVLLEIEKLRRVKTMMDEAGRPF